MARRLIICLDGTWSTPDQDTNVVKMARAVSPQAPDGPQVVFYDPGVGTGNFLDRISGGAFGIGLSENVRQAYRFLVHNFVENDEVYLFGFSRGAFTARSVAGFMRKCGLLPKKHGDRVDDAFKIYKRRDETPDTEEAKKFRRDFGCTEVSPKFIGVWDTVGSLGVPVPIPVLGRFRFRFHDVRLGRRVAYGYQALAIDERRRPFSPTLWEEEIPDQETDRPPRENFEQAWFAGCHSDVGGGHKQSGLSDTAMLWIIEKAEASGLVFDGAYVQGLRATARPTGRLHKSNNGFWHLLGSREREIGKSNSECVHAAVRDRFNSDLEPPYRPRNLPNDFQENLCG